LPPLLGQPAVLAGGLLAFVAGVALQRLTEHGVGIQVQAEPDTVLVLTGWFVLAQRADRRLTHAGWSFLDGGWFAVGLLSAGGGVQGLAEQATQATPQRSELVAILTQCGGEVQGGQFTGRGARARIDELAGACPEDDGGVLLYRGLRRCAARRRSGLRARALQPSGSGNALAAAIRHPLRSRLNRAPLAHPWLRALQLDWRGRRYGELDVDTNVRVLALASWLLRSTAGTSGSSPNSERMRGTWRGVAQRILPPGGPSHPFFRPFGNVRAFRSSWCTMSGSRLNASGSIR